ncbi:hypothetical protein EDD17DRAFT_1764341 [Pisolithus thermaeus]|nr:hypothetical protein EDD17DRAFT_1764341 [Pisolithus thermaeus]
MQGQYHEFNLKHVKSHQSSNIHQCHLKLHASSQKTLSGYKSAELLVKEPFHPPPDLARSLNTIHEMEMMNLDNHWIGGIPDKSEPMFVTPEVLLITLLKTTEPKDDQPVPSSELWHAISTSHHQRINGTRDLFQELQDALASGEALFSMPVSPLNTSLSDDIACDTESDFSIELSNYESGETPQPYSMKWKASVDSPMYLWPMKGHFLTAILHWAKQLSACNMLSLYALQRCYEVVQKMVGDPTDKIISPLGNVFYINDIAKAITKDYANPLT